jgi:hypothetical protein
MSNQPSILLVLGPSGVGKSTFGKYLRSNHAWLHLEIDQFPNGDGIDLLDLRAPWDRFFQNQDPTGLVDELTRRVDQHGNPGVVLTFPSRLVLPPVHIERAGAVGVQTVYLYGTAANCLTAFLARERATCRSFDVNHWLRNNGREYLLMSVPEFETNRVMVFGGDGVRRPWQDVLDEISTGREPGVVHDAPARDTGS